MDMLLPLGPGLIVGLILGLTGAGGSIFAVPLLMWVMGWTLPQAVPVALLAVAVSATFGTLQAWPTGQVRYRAAMVIAFSGLLTAPLGLFAAEWLPVALLSVLFSAVILLAAVRLLLRTYQTPSSSTQALTADSRPNEVPAPHEPLCQVRPETGRLRWTRPCTLAMTASGLSTGFLSGLLGVGGGFIIVPAIQAVSNLSFHAATATSLMAIALTSAWTVLMALLAGKTLPWLVALPFIAATLAGMLVGRRLAPRLSGKRLQTTFALLMMAVSFGMLSHALF